MANPWEISIGDAEIADPWQVDIGQAQIIPDWEAGPLELPDPWQIDIGDAQLNPYIDVNIGDARVLGDNEFFLDNGDVGSVNVGDAQIYDPWSLSK